MLTPEERQDLACLAEHYGYGIHRCYAGDNPPLFAAVERIRDEAVAECVAVHEGIRAQAVREAERAAERALVERVEDFIDGGEWGHGLSCASWYAARDCNCWQSGLLAALAARPDVRGEGEG